MAFELPLRLSVTSTEVYCLVDTRAFTFLCIVLVGDYFEAAMESIGLLAVP